MVIRSLGRCSPAVVLLAVLLFGSGVGWAAVWDHSCENAISSLQGTQQRIRLVRGELVAHDMQNAPSPLTVEGEWPASRFTESNYLATEQEMRNLIETFNERLKEFAETCLKGPDAK